MAKSKSFKIGRDSKTGRLITVKDAKRRPNQTTVEHMPKPGNDTAPKSK